MNFLNIFKRENLTLILLILILVLGGLLVYQNYKIAHQQEQLIIDKENQEAYFDTITKSINKKLDAFQWDRKAFIGRLDDIKNLDKDLYDLAKSNKNTLTAINSKVGIVLENVESIKNKDNIINLGDSKYRADWQFLYEDEGLTQSTNGFTKFLVNSLDTNCKFTIQPLGSTMEKSITKLKLGYGIKEDKNGYNAFVVSKSDKVVIEELSGYQKYIPKSRKPWVISIGIGYGGYYDKNDNVVRSGPTATATLGWKLFEFGKRVKK